MKARLFSLAAVVGALGAGLCCLGPVIFSFLGVSAVASLTTLSWVVPYRNAFFALTIVGIGMAIGHAIVRRGRVSRREWAVLAGSVIVVIGLLGYAVRVEGVPSLW
jgi:hypothetical protein